MRLVLPILELSAALIIIIVMAKEVVIPLLKGEPLFPMFRKAFGGDQK